MEYLNIFLFYNELKDEPRFVCIFPTLILLKYQSKMFWDITPKNILKKNAKQLSKSNLLSNYNRSQVDFQIIVYIDITVADIKPLTYMR